MLQERLENEALVRSTGLDYPADAKRRESLRQVTKRASRRSAVTATVAKQHEGSLFRHQLASAVAASSAYAKDAALATLEHMDAYEFCNNDIHVATVTAVTRELASQLSSQGVAASGDAQLEEESDQEETEDTIRSSNDIEITCLIGDDEKEQGDEHVKAFGLSSSVVVSRIGAMQMHFRRLLAADLVQNVAVQCINSGVCICCPVAKVGCMPSAPTVSSLAIRLHSIRTSRISGTLIRRKAEVAARSQGVMPNMASTITEHEFKELMDWRDHVENVPDVRQWSDADFEAQQAIEAACEDTNTLTPTINCISTVSISVFSYEPIIPPTFNQVPVTFHLRSSCPRRRKLSQLCSALCSYLDRVWNAHAIPYNKVFSQLASNPAQGLYLRKGNPTPSRRDLALASSCSPIRSHLMVRHAQSTQLFHPRYPAEAQTSSTHALCHTCKQIQCSISGRGK